MSCISPVVYGRTGVSQVGAGFLTCCACAGSHRVNNSRNASRRRIVGLLFLKIFRVDLRKMLPLIRQVFNWEDRRHRANWDAGSAVNALGGMDVKLGLCSKVSLIFAWVNTVHRADVHARRVLGSDAGFSNDVSHGGYLNMPMMIMIPMPITTVRPGFSLIQSRISFRITTSLFGY